MQYYLPWRGNGRLASNECSSFPIPHRFSVVENAGLRKTSWLTSRRDDPAREETVRLSFKPRQMSTYSPAVWRSGKLRTVTAGTLEIKSVRIELLVPHSAWGLGLLVGHVISTLLGIVVLQLLLKGNWGSSTDPHAAGIGPWHILSWRASGSHALQRLGFGFNQGTYTYLRGLML